MNEENTGGNPTDQDVSEDAAQNAVFDGSSDSFFDDLDNDVNGIIKDDDTSTEATHQTSGTEQATHSMSDDGSNNVGMLDDDGSESWQKRYSDSSREAVKLKAELNELSPFVPVLEAMKKDSGLVDHVRSYLVNGGTPSKTIKENLGLGEDFIFDPSDAFENADSESAKLMNAHVDQLVQKRVGQIVQHEQKNAQDHRHKAQKQAEQKAFKEKRNMTDDQFTEFVAAAKQRTLSLDDVDYLLNRDKAAANVAQSTKKDMLDQMKSVRNMPTSASGANNQGDRSEDDSVFGRLLGLDNELDNLFG